MREETNIATLVERWLWLTMVFAEVAEGIPQSLLEKTSQKLMDLMLKSSQRMPTQLVKKILSSWQRDELKTRAGLEFLLEAAMISDPEKTAKYFSEGLGLPELGDRLKQSIGSK